MIFADCSELYHDFDFNFFFVYSVSLPYITFNTSCTTVAQLKEALHDFIGKIFVKGFLDSDDYFKSQITDNQQVPLDIFLKVRFLLPFTCFGFIQ